MDDYESKFRQKMKQGSSSNSHEQSESKKLLLPILLFVLAIVIVVVIYVLSFSFAEKTATIDLGCSGEWRVAEIDENIITVEKSDYNETSKCQTFTIKGVSKDFTVIKFIRGKSDKTGEMRFFNVSVEDTRIEISEIGDDGAGAHRYDEYIDMGVYDGEEHQGQDDGY